jgi:uncharacterized membrane protein
MPNIDLDFTEVDTSGGGGYLAPGVYRARVDKVEQKDGANYPGLKLAFVSEETDTYGQRSELFVSLSPKAMWKVYLTLEALGVPVAKERQRLNTNKLVGLMGMVKVINDPWTDADGKVHDSSKVESVFPVTGDAKPVAAAAPDTSGDNFNREPDGSEDFDDIPF